MLKYFGIPFANAGGKTAVPAADPGTGAVSYATGWGPYYQLAKTDPNCLNIDRQQTNQTLFDITSEIKLLQEHGVPDFITSALNGGAAYSYDAGDTVRYLGAQYVSRVAANTALPSDASKWALVRLGGRPGDIFLFGGTSAPAGSLLCPLTATNVSRTTYASLFAAIGTTWGVGDGATTFGIPFFPANYAPVQANGNVGASTVGEVISHAHLTNNNGATNGTGGNPNLWLGGLSNQIFTVAFGGAANLAAGQRVLICVQY